MMSFDRFTERAQEAAKRAYEVLIHYKHTQLDTEHIFLALVQQTDGTVSELLRRQDARGSDLAIPPACSQFQGSTVLACHMYRTNPRDAVPSKHLHTMPPRLRCLKIAYTPASLHQHIIDPGMLLTELYLLNNAPA